MERDIVERISQACEPGNWHKVSHTLLNDAVSEITRLRVALRSIRENIGPGHGECKVRLLLTAANLRQLAHAMDELNGIDNSPEFASANLSR